MASLEAAKEAFRGIYSAEQWSERFNCDRVLPVASQLLELTYQKESKDLPETMRKFLERLDS